MTAVPAVANRERTVPAVLTEPGMPPPPNPKGTPCRECGLAYELHTGNLCRICRAPVEHHDAERVTHEIAACARLSAARLAAGHPIRTHERWCIERHTERIPPTT